MRIIIGVTDFGKIKKAEIDISNFTIFVGNNNSGKTYMMQLIYGLIKKLPNIELYPEDYDIFEKKQLIWGEEWIQTYQEKLNEYLHENKETIVRDIFHKSISIGNMYFKFLNIDKSIKINIDRDKTPDFLVEENDENATEDYLDSEYSFQVDIALMDAQSKKRDTGIITWFSSPHSEKLMKKVIWKITIELILGVSNGQLQELYLPASRTGMLLLYKYFFAEKDAKLYGIVRENKGEYGERFGNELGLSAPVYDFLQFLLRYTPNESVAVINQKLVSFIEEKLIDGSIKQVGEETMYLPKLSEGQVPLYLASSMVNELTPLLKALTGNTRYQYLFYDEIETCLHPEKQGQMARLLIRLNNSGKKLIVSTHSDTMASKINNLLLLSFAEESEESKKEKMEKLNLTEEDLLKLKEVHAYQFVNQEDGTSVVNELEFRKVPYVGYDFSQFMDNAQNLYDESLTIMG